MVFADQTNCDKQLCGFSIKPGPIVKVRQEPIHTINSPVIKRCVVNAEYNGRKSGRCLRANLHIRNHGQLSRVEEIKLVSDMSE